MNTDFADLLEWAEHAAKIPPKVAFDGSTYDHEQDYCRLKGQLGRVRLLMNDGKWRTLAEIANDAGGSEASISARLRDLRKHQYGGYVIERERVSGGLYRYRLRISDAKTD